MIVNEPAIRADARSFILAVYSSLTVNSTLLFILLYMQGTGSGKSTLARNLIDQIGTDHITYLVHDSYYKDQSHLTSIDERKVTNFDHPDALETDLMLEHIRQLKQGRTVHVPTYDFTTHTRTPNTVVTMDPRPILLVEGILILCHARLVQELDLKVFVVRTYVRLDTHTHTQQYLLFYYYCACL